MTQTVTPTKSGNEATSIPFVATDFINSYPSGNLTKVKIVGSPMYGVLSLSGSAVTVNQDIPINSVNNITYVPNTSYIGSDSFVWRGGNAASYTTNTFIVNLIITPNSYQVPTLTDIEKTGAENEPITFTPADFANNFNCFDNMDLAKVKIYSLPSNGVLKLSNRLVKVNQGISVAGLGGLTYTPTENYVGADSFAWNATDGLMYSPSGSNVNLLIAEAALKEEPSWISSISGIATICGSTLGGISAICGTTYTIHKCKQDGAFCFKNKGEPTAAVSSSSEIQIEDVIHMSVNPIATNPAAGNKV